MSALRSEPVASPGRTLRWRPVAVRAAITIAIIGGAVLVAPRSAEADCRTSSVCYWQGGHQICRTDQQCTSRRVPVCTYVNRCVPIRTCSTVYGRTTCVYREVCRSERVCS
jgi:hypothetical protein